MYILFSIFYFFPFFHYGLSQDIESSFLCYMVGSYCLSILLIYVIVCIGQPQTTNLSSATVLPPWQPGACSLCLDQRALSAGAGDDSPHLHLCCKTMRSLGKVVWGFLLIKWNRELVTWDPALQFPSISPWERTADIHPKACDGCSQHLCSLQPKLEMNQGPSPGDGAMLCVCRMGHDGSARKKNKLWTQLGWISWASGWVKAARRKGACAIEPCSFHVCV